MIKDLLSRIYIDKDLFEYNDLNVEKVVQDIMDIFEGIKRWNNTVEEECPEHIYDFLS